MSLAPLAAETSKHRLFGLTLASDFAFESRLTSGRGPVDLTFSASSSAPVGEQPGRPLFSSPFKDEAGQRLARLYELGDGELLRFGRALDFYFAEGGVHCHLQDPEDRRFVEIRLLGAVLAYWLERRSICALHASAVVVDGQAVAFVASNHGGKSGLAAAMMRLGKPLLTDDLLPIEERQERFLARAGYPQMRLRPDAAEHFLSDGLRRVPRRLGKLWVPVGPDRLGAFHAEAAPAGCLYLPERLPPGSGTGEIRIAPLSRREAVIELVRRSFSPFLVEAVGLQPERLGRLGRLVGQVPVRRLLYPSGLGELPRVCQALLADLEAL